MNENGSNNGEHGVSTSLYIKDAISIIHSETKKALEVVIN